jgi:hypothetical protein
MATALNLALEPTPKSLCSYVAPALGRGSPRAFGLNDTTSQAPRKCSMDLGIYVQVA